MTAMAPTPRPAEFFERLKAGGINVVDFNPINLFDAKAGCAPDARDHRKILRRRRQMAIVGGVNLSADCHVHSRWGKPTDRSVSFLAEFWRDTDMQVEGPVVAQLQRLFLPVTRAPRRVRRLTQAKSLSDPLGKGRRGRPYSRQRAQGCRAALLRDGAFGHTQCGATHFDIDGLFRADRQGD